MVNVNLIRITLWLSFPFNLVAAGALAFPASALGQLMGLPGGAPRVYSALTGFLVGLFGLTYAWLARQAHIHRPLLAFSAIGKGGAFTIALILWSSGDASGRLLAASCGDLILAGLWFWWLAISKDP
jgi:hypothetical protein